jgi:hypothetical protein
MTSKGLSAIFKREHETQPKLEKLDQHDLDKQMLLNKLALIEREKKFLENENLDFCREMLKLKETVRTLEKQVKESEEKAKLAQSQPQPQVQVQVQVQPQPLSPLEEIATIDQQLTNSDRARASTIAARKSISPRKSILGESINKIQQKFRQRSVSPVPSPVAKKEREYDPKTGAVIGQRNLGISPIDTDQVAGSVWETIAEEAKAVSVGELEALDVKDEKDNYTADGGLDDQAVGEILNVLKKIKVPPEIVKEHVLAVNDNTFDLDDLLTIKKHLPKQDLLGQEDLANDAEIMYRELSSIPALADRLDMWIFKKSFTKEFFLIAEQSRIIEDSLKFIRNSSEIKSILAAMLAAGNSINSEKLQGINLRATLRELSLRNRADLVDSSKKYAAVLVSYLKKKNIDALSFSLKLKDFKKASYINQISFFQKIKSMVEKMDQLPQAWMSIKPIGEGDMFASTLEAFFKEYRPLTNGLVKKVETLMKEAESLSQHYRDDDSKGNWENLFELFLMLSEFVKKCLIDTDESKSLSLEWTSNAAAGNTSQPISPQLKALGQRKSSGRHSVFVLSKK